MLYSSVIYEYAKVSSPVVLYCIALQCFVLYCIALLSILFYCIVLYCSTLYCSTLYCIIKVTPSAQRAGMYIWWT